MCHTKGAGGWLLPPQQVTNGLGRKMKSNIVLQMDVKDFEALANTYMAFNKSWNKQIRDGRFEGIQSNPGYSVIYWFDNALALIIAKSYLASIGQDFKDLYDNNSDEYCIITNFEVREGLANAS